SNQPIEIAVGTLKAIASGCEFVTESDGTLTRSHIPADGIISAVDDLPLYVAAASAATLTGEPDRSFRAKRDYEKAASSSSRPIAAKAKALPKHKANAKVKPTAAPVMADVAMDKDTAAREGKPSSAVDPESDTTDAGDEASSPLTFVTFINAQTKEHGQMSDEAPSHIRVSSSQIQGALKNSDTYMQVLTTLPQNRVRLRASWSFMARKILTFDGEMRLNGTTVELIEEIGHIVDDSLRSPALQSAATERLAKQYIAKLQHETEALQRGRPLLLPPRFIVGTLRPNGTSGTVLMVSNAAGISKPSGMSGTAPAGIDCRAALSNLVA
ncbi:Eno2, partial [Symbiodinium necroappetens]